MTAVPHALGSSVGDAADPTPIERTHPRTIGWLGTTALSFGGSNQSLFLLGALVASQGTAALPLLAVGLLLSWAATPGWTELVMMWPNRVGGIAATCSEAFRPYSPVLANLTGTCYWWGWVPTCGLTAILSGSAVHQWYLPGVPVKVLASLIIFVFTVVNLCGVRWVTRLAVVIASLSAALALLSALIPVISGTVDWRVAASIHLTTPFSGAFGVVSSAMAGLYLIGFAAPAFEAATCHVGETRNHEKEVPRAIFASAGIASLYFVVLPVIWLGVLGPARLSGDLALSLGPTFGPLLGAGAKAAALWFMVFNMFHGTLQPLAGASRTLSQLSEDGLLPRSLAKRNRYDCPWVATVLTAGMSTALLVSGDPPAVLAAANLTYLIAICMPSIAVWLLRRHAPDMPRPWRAPRYTIGLGVFAACVWGVATILGFQQYGLEYVLLGLVLAYSGSVAYSWRTWRDRRASGVRGVKRSLGVKLTGSMVLVMALDGAGYLLAVSHVDNGRTELVTVLQDIFVAVALLTISVGLVLPGMISHAVLQVTDAAQRLQHGALRELSRAMQALGDGNLAGARIDPQIVLVDVRTADEVAVMADSFNAMQREVVTAAHSLDGARGELQASRERLEQLANHDALTGLLNRRRFDELLAEAVDRSSRTGRDSCLTMFDLDNFKMINDSRGHTVGDDVLRLVAGTLVAELGPQAVLARLGGDEFAYLLPETELEDGLVTAQRIIGALQTHSAATEQGRRVKVSASAGVACIQASGKATSGQLMMDVDVAMYEAKDAGGNRVVLAAPDGAGRESITTRQEWLDTLREALDGEGFQLYAQPIVSLADGATGRYEILLRLIGRNGEVLTPGDYLPLAERHGLIREIDRWVVRSSFSLLREQLASQPQTHFEVNLSGLSIGDPELEALIRQEMSVGDVPAGAMIFEITETAAIIDLAGAEAFARRIAALGCGWALDDFGAGFSSFLYLKSLPFDYVKIDGSFVCDVTSSERDRLVIRAIVDIAHCMGQETIAEFVEDQETMSTLRELGVDYAQGYFVGRPAPLGRQSAPVPELPAASPRPPSEDDLLRLAAAAGCPDVLVFRQITPGRFVHLGGTGRGSGWAGNIELDADAIHLVRRPREVVRLSAGQDATHVIGPYYARSAAVVEVSADVLVVLGNQTGSLSADDAALLHVAELAPVVVDAVSPAKRLADELELLHAMKAVMHCPTGTVTETLRHVALTAAEGLSCEFAAVWLPEAGQLEVVDRGWASAPDREAVRHALEEIVSLGTPVCTQDSRQQPLPEPLGPASGVTSHFMLDLGAPVQGYLVLLHTQAAPRGFTDLCQQVGQTVAQAAGLVIHSAQLRNSLHELVEDARVTARMDALTGLLNRRGWDEAVASWNRNEGDWASVALVDLNDLKAVNDTLGHAAGDDYLRCAAMLLERSAPPGAVVARVGGDEFGVLVRTPDAPVEGALASTLRAAFEATGGVRGSSVRAGVGSATCAPADDLSEAINRADVALYVDKALVRPRSAAHDRGPRALGARSRP